MNKHETKNTTHPVAAERGTAPDLSKYLALHEAMRVSNQQLVDGLSTPRASHPERAAALKRWFDGYAGELRAHHRIEDAIFFPTLAERVPAYAEYSTTLADDHHHLDVVLDSLANVLGNMADATPAATGADSARTNALALAIELRDFLLEHLESEDNDVLPMFERHFTVEEYDAMDAQAVKEITLGQALFTAPWFMASVDAETAAETLREAPLPLRIVFRLRRRNYARLVQAAFGGAS